MNILAVCDNPEVAEVMKIINTIILLIRIAIPIILIVVLSIDFMGAIKTGDKDLLKEKTNGAVKKIIAATLIFLIPSFVNLIVKLSNPSNEYLSCLSIKSDADIQTVYSKKAEELVSKAESTKTLSDYSSAKIIVNKMSNSAKKDAYNSRLDAVYAIIQDRMDEANKGDQTDIGGVDTGSDTTTVMSGTIYMGDSRTNGMKSALGSNEQAVAKDGGNYSDFSSHVSSVKSILSSNNGKYYNIVLNYGVNDLGNSSKYCSAYKSFFSSIDSKNRIYVVSVNPVNDSISQYAKNAAIATFNSAMKSCISSLKNVKYCDVNGSANLTTWTSEYLKNDGIHYNSTGYSYIHSKILSCIG